MVETFRTPQPVCPHCGHAMNTDEMLYGKPTCEEDLFGLAPNEGTAAIECPACDKHFWVQGGYAPLHHRFSEEEL